MIKKNIKVKTPGRSLIKVKFGFFNVIRCKKFERIASILKF